MAPQMVVRGALHEGVGHSLAPHDAVPTGVVDERRCGWLERGRAEQEEARRRALLREPRR